MRIKSWHVALVGIALQFALGALFFSGIKVGGFGGIIFAVLGGFFLATAAIALLPFAFLFFERTRRLGAVLCIIFGVVGVITQVGLIAGFFLLVAGVLHLWKNI